MVTKKFTFKQALFLIFLFFVFRFFVSFFIGSIFWPSALFEQGLQEEIFDVPASLVYLVINLANLLFVIYIFWRYRLSWHRLRGRRKQRKYFYLWAFLLFIGLAILMECLAQFVISYDATSEGGVIYNLFDEFFVFLTICLFGPILEEIIFRGLLLKNFLKIYSNKKAIFLSALIFGLVHWHWLQSSITFVLGLFLGWIYTRSKSLIPAVVSHIVYNTSIAFVPFLLFYLNGASAFPAYLLITGLLAFLTGWVGLKKNFLQEKSTEMVNVAQMVTRRKLDSREICRTEILQLAEFQWEIKKETGKPGPESKEELLDQYATDLLAGLVKGNWTYWVVWHEDRIIAQAFVQFIFDSPFGDGEDLLGRISHLYTKQDYRNQGVGTYLLNKIVSWAKIKDIHSLQIQCSEDELYFLNKTDFDFKENLMEIKTKNERKIAQIFQERYRQKVKVAQAKGQLNN